MVEQEPMSITEAEAAQYDRQIRLWGLDAQRRLRGAKVLLVGVGGLGAEVAKNIVLAGINSLTLLDHRKVTDIDACSQFLVNRKDIGENRADASRARAQLLNPLVAVTSDPGDVADKDTEFITQFHVVVVTQCCNKQISRLNEICHTHNIMFFAGDVFGHYGYCFADLNEHHYAEDVIQQKKKASTEDEPPAKKQKQDTEEETKTVKKVSKFSRFQSALDLDWTSDQQKNKIKRTSSTYFIMQALLAFQAEQGRRPAPETSAADTELLTKHRTALISRLQLPDSALPDNFAQYCFAELCPVCAVTGGVLGQEIIKAVSQKDAPHNNFFFYNAVEGSGIVDLLA